MNLRTLLFSGRATGGRASGRGRGREEHSSVHCCVSPLVVAPSETCRRLLRNSNTISAIMPGFGGHACAQGTAAGGAKRAGRPRARRHRRRRTPRPLTVLTASQMSSSAEQMKRTRATCCAITSDKAVFPAADVIVVTEPCPGATPRLSDKRQVTMLLGCSSSPRPMPPRSAPSSAERVSCRLLSGLRRRFPGITDNTKARAYVRSITGWMPLQAL